jgi:glycosyltransferase involved in cell wall biosynthesis
MGRVSIVIPFYNCSYVDKAIQSALNQTYRNVEVIVVDDGSTAYTGKITPYLKSVKYIKKANGGTASALNTGIMNSTGDYFAWLSSDDLYYPKKVETQLAFMEANHSSACYMAYYVINSKDQITGGPIASKFSKPEQIYMRMKKGCVINGCTVMFKRNVFEEVGVFDETLKYAHDYDLWLRVLLKYHFDFLDETLVMYRIHQEMGTKKFPEEIANEIRFVRNKYRKSMNRLIKKYRGKNE